MSKALLLAIALGASWALALGRRVPKGSEERSMDAAKMAAAEVHPNEWRGAYCAQTGPSARIIESGAEWDRLWKGSLGQTPPEVDFSKHLAAAVFLGARPTGGYSIEFLDPLSDGKELVLRYRERRPKGLAIQAFTQPYAIKLYRRTGLRVSLAEAK